MESTQGKKTYFLWCADDRYGFFVNIFSGNYGGNSLCRDAGGA